MNPRISVVVPTYNSVQTLGPCIESIYSQTIKPFEVIIIDNASSDGTWQMLGKNFPKAKKIRLEENTGVTGGRNEGIKNVSKQSGYIFFFDHDMIADKKLLRALVEALKSDPQAGIITPKIYYWDDK